MKRGELLPCELCGKDAKPMRGGSRLVEHVRCALCGYWDRAQWQRIQRAIAARIVAAAEDARREERP